MQPPYIYIISQVRQVRKIKRDKKISIFNTFKAHFVLQVSNMGVGLIIPIEPLSVVGIVSIPTLAYATPHLPNKSKSLYFSNDVKV